MRILSNQAVKEPRFVLTVDSKVCKCYKFNAYLLIFRYFGVICSSQSQEGSIKKRKKITDHFEAVMFDTLSIGFLPGVKL